MTRQQLEQQLHQTTDGGRRPLRMRGSDLRSYDFSGLDLTGADFSFSNLGKANFKESILRNADLSFSSLSKASFRDADLTGANLNFSDMHGADLTGANLTGVSMSFTGAGSRNSELAPARAEPITLTTVLQKPGWGTLIGMALGALLIYGCNGVIYFTNLILTSQDPLMIGYYTFLIVQNIVDGAAVFLLTWALSTWLARRFRVAWQRYLFLSWVVAINFLVLNTIIYFWLGKAYLDQLAARPNFESESAAWYVYGFGNILIANVFLYVLQQGRQLTRKLSEQEFKLLNLEKLKIRAELDALQAKINPHFLYNALNSIASLVHSDAEKAEEMTLLLSKLFRYSTGRDGELFGTLADELEMVRTYLQVEKVRFGNRLTFSVEVSDSTLIDLKLPQFLLQPIVENAIKHGIAKCADAGRIDVRIYEKSGDGDPGELCLCVHDNGPTFPDDMGGGYGLRSIQEKLNLLYGDDARVEFQNWPIKQALISIGMSRLRMNKAT